MPSCAKCGREISGGAPARWDGNERVCEECHRALVAQTERVIAAGRPPRRNASSRGNTMGLVGFILSIVSLVFFFGIASPIALVFSLLGLKREPRGIAIAGTVISALGTALFVCLVCFFLINLAAFMRMARHGGAVPPKHPPARARPLPRKAASSTAPPRSDCHLSGNL